MMTTEDMELLREYARHGSEEAFARLVSRHVNLVFSVALRQLRDAGLAEEVTQAAFIVLARKAGSLGPKTILSAWLCRTAQYIAARALRTQRRRQSREQEIYMQSLLNQPEPEISPWPDIAPLLDVAMAGLGEKDHSAIVLRYFEGRDLKQVGAALGVKENAAKTRVSRAVEKLRQFFVKRGVTLSAAVIAGAISANSVQAAPAALAKSVTALAIAKGTTASGSTLTLIKGALKFMAWTTAKTAIVAGAVALLVTGTTMVTVRAVHEARAASAPDIQGAWEGVSNEGIGAKRLDIAHSRIVLKISKTNGVYSAMADYIDLGRKDAWSIAPRKVMYDFPAVRFEVEPWGTVEATLNADATKMTYGPGLVLQRTNAPDTVPERLTAKDFAPRPGSDLQGCWRWDNTNFPMIWKIAESTDGSFRAELDLPERGASHWPVSVSYNPPKVQLRVATGFALFYGKLNSTRAEIKGTFLRGGYPVEVTLKRVDYQPEPARPESDYSFASPSDLQGHWRAALPVKMGQMKKQPLALDVAKLADGNYSAALARPFSIGKDDPVPAADFQYPLPNVRLKWKYGYAFEGKLAKGKLTGNWREDGESHPVTFERSQTQ